jgi:hypothetical protein
MVNAVERAFRFVERANTGWVHTRATLFYGTAWKRMRLADDSIVE